MSTISVVGAAILSNGRCLVARRGPGMTMAGRWEFPGGKVEHGESAEHALVREIAEELGIPCTVGEILARGDAITSSGRVVLDVFAVEGDGEPEGREHSELRWVGPEDLYELDWALADIPVLPAVCARLVGGPAQHIATQEPVILSVDWGREPEKRAACIATPEDGGWRVDFKAPPTDGWRVAALLELARNLAKKHNRPALVGIDAVLGVPTVFGIQQGQPGFQAILDHIAESGGLVKESPSASDWHTEHPFFGIPPGKGSLDAFYAAAGGRSSLLRLMDRRTGGNPTFALRGIPGTVGSGTRELWKELRAASRLNSAFSVWPFDGSIADLTTSAEVILGEVYPRAAYALALSAQLPTQPRDVAKTKRGAREHAIEGLKKATWPARAGLRLPDLKPALDSEDDFDALMVAVALVRLLHEGLPLSHELVDPRFEGGILGTGGIVFSRRSAQPRPHFSKATRSPTKAPSKRDLPCPIPGCDKIFHNSRGGWDAHVASPKQHTTWRDGERDPERLKARFREEFPDWF